MFVTIGAALLTLAPVRWAYQLLGIGRREEHGSAKDKAFWRSFAERFHLRVELDADRAPSLHGHLEGIAFSVRPSVSPARDNTPMIMTAISRPALTAGTPLQHVPSRVRTGDEAFDRACHVTGDVSVLVACLNAPARERVAALLAGGGRLDRGQATLRLPSKLDDEEARAGANLVFHAAFAIDHAIAGRLERLLQIADEDPAPGVRARALWCASTLAPQEHAVSERLTRASRDPVDPAQDLVGRLHRGDLAGAAALLLEAEDPSLLHLAGLIVPSHDLGLVLTPSFAAATAALQGALAEVGLRAEERDRLALLSALAQSSRLTTDDGADALRALTEACADVASEGFEPTMCALVAHPAKEVSDAALRALMARGSVRAVPLLRAEETRASRPLADRIRSVIVSIQAAVGPVDAGRVSIAEDGARGGVSVAADDQDVAASADDQTP